MVKVDIRKE